MVLNFINSTIAKYFGHDLDAARMLDDLENKSFQIKLTDIGKEFLVVPGNKTIQVSEFKKNNEIVSDTVIKATVLSLLRLALGSDYQVMLNSGKLQIEGDIELANQLNTVLKNIDIDWEEIASKYMGDATAHQIGIFSKRFKNYRDRSVENFKLDVSEYLQEESRIVPTKLELDKFLNNVDELEADIDRLEMRTNRLLNVHEKRN